MEFAIYYNDRWSNESDPHGGIGKVKLWLDDNCYDIDLNPKYNPKGESIEEFFPKQLAVRLAQNYPDIPQDIWMDFAYDTFAALQRFGFQHITDAFTKILTEQEKES